MFTRQNYLSGLNVGTEKRAAAFSLLIEQIAVVVCTTKCDAPTRTRKPVHAKWPFQRNSHFAFSSFARTGRFAG